jgi:hypothetical protein
MQVRGVVAARNAPIAGTMVSMAVIVKAEIMGFINGETTRIALGPLRNSARRRTAET